LPTFGIGSTGADGPAHTFAVAVVRPVNVHNRACAWLLRSDLVLEHTLQLLSDFCLSFNVVRKYERGVQARCARAASPVGDCPPVRLVKLDSIQFMLGNHTPANFPFLTHVRDSRHRTTFYTVRFWASGAPCGGVAVRVWVRVNARVATAGAGPHHDARVCGRGPSL
jgi:hypothetical protein